MAVTNTKFKVTDRDLRISGSTTVHSDDATQPRILQPVAASTDVTTANGFTTTNLKPGDMLMVVDDTGYKLWIRNGPNTGWVKATLA